MKKQGNFQTEDPKRLSEQLDRLQDAVVQETSDIRLGFMPQLEQKRFSSVTTPTATLLPGQIGLCDSNLGNIVVTLAAGKPGWLAVVKRSNANALTLVASGTTGGVARKINAAASKFYGPGIQGLSWVYFDGTNWWT